MDDERSRSGVTGAQLADKILALGRDKQLGIVAAVLGTFGFLGPLASAQTGGFFGASAEVSYSLSQAGLTGVLALALSVAFGTAPFYLRRSRRNDILYYGAAAGCFGAVLCVWLVSLSLPIAIAAVGHLAPAFYALFASFAISAYLSGIRCYEAWAR